MDAPRPTPDDKSGQPEVVASPTGSPSINPRWLAMDEEVARHEVELRQMLTLYTPEHPRVQAAQRKIDTLRSIRDELPRTQPIDAGGPTSPFGPSTQVVQSSQPDRAEPNVSEDDSKDVFLTMEDQQQDLTRLTLSPPAASQVTESTAPDLAQALDEMVSDDSANFPPERAAAPDAKDVAESNLEATFDDATDEALDDVFNEAEVRAEIMASSTYLNLQDQHQHAQRELAAAVEHFASVQLAEEAVQGARLASITEPAHVVRKQIASLSALQLVALFGLALAIGMAAIFVRGKSVLPDVVVDAADVERTLGLSIVGAISTRDGPEIPCLVINPIPRPVRWLVQVGEVAVVASAALVVISFVLVPKFAGLFVANPFSAFVFVIDRLSSVFY